MKFIYWYSNIYTKTSSQTTPISTLQFLKLSLLVSCNCQNSLQLGNKKFLVSVDIINQHEKTCIDSFTNRNCTYNI